MTVPAPEDSASKAQQDADGREQLVANAVAEYTQLLSQGEALEIEGYCRCMRGWSRNYGWLSKWRQASTGCFSPRAPLPDHPREAAVPTRLSGHKNLGEIGCGGMGRVLLAMDERLGRKVAIKVLSHRFQDNPLLRERFMQEARAMAKLSTLISPTFTAWARPRKPPHFVMEYLDGTP